jgi:hypothetical protein
MERQRITPQIQVRTHVKSGQGGGYIGGVYYPDRSGVCGSAPVPLPIPPNVPPQTGGGYVGGVWYADRSGLC